MQRRPGPVPEHSPPTPKSDRGTRKAFSNTRSFSVANGTILPRRGSLARPEASGQQSSALLPCFESFRATSLCLRPSIAGCTSLLDRRSWVCRASWQTSSAHLRHGGPEDRHPCPLLVLVLVVLREAVGEPAACFQGNYVIDSDRLSLDGKQKRESTPTRISPRIPSCDDAHHHHYHHRQQRKRLHENRRYTQRYEDLRDVR